MGYVQNKIGNKQNIFCLTHVQVISADQYFVIKNGCTTLLRKL